MILKGLWNYKVQKNNYPTSNSKFFEHGKGSSLAAVGLREAPHHEWWEAIPKTDLNNFKPASALMWIKVVVSEYSDKTIHMQLRFLKIKIAIDNN